MEKIIEQAANRLQVAAKSGQVCTPVRDLIGIEDLNLAYQIQSVNIKKQIQSGSKIVGRKIGLTAYKVQQQFGIDQPDFGVLLDSMQVENGSEVPWNALMQPKVEAEISFVLKKDLDSNTLSLNDVEEAIDHAVVSIEIVGSRIADWDIRISDTIADNASASHFVLGDTKMPLEGLDLMNCRLVMKKNGEKASEGIGSDSLGNPIAAVKWLADISKRLGNPLRKGEVILSGCLGIMVGVDPGDHIEAGIEGWGKVSVTFGK